MAGGYKGNNNLQPALYGVQVSTSLYNTAIPVIYGMRRVSVQLINSWDFHKTSSSAKKGKGGKKGGPPAYAADNDFLISFGPVWNVWGVWRNGQIYGYYLNSEPPPPGEVSGPNRLFTQTFSISSGSWEPTFLGWTTSVEVSTSIDGIFAVSLTYEQTAELVNYGGPGGTFTGNVEQFLYNTSYEQGAPDTYAWRPGTQFLGVPLCNAGRCTFGIGANRTDRNVSLTMPNTWTPVDGTATVYYGKSSAAVPYSHIGYQFETQLGMDAADHGATPPLVYPDFSGFYAPNQDLGMAGTTPNDNFEVQGLYGLNNEGNCNPADVMLDIILSGNIFLPGTNGAQFDPIAWGHGLDFGSDPTRVSVIDGSVFPYPPVLTFPYVLSNPLSVFDLLKDPPVFAQLYNPANQYPVGAIVYFDGNWYECVKNTAPAQPWALQNNYAIGAVDTDSTAYNGDVTAGSLLIAYVTQFAGGILSPTTDTIGNDWILAGTNFGVTGFADHYGEVWYCINKASGPNTVSSVGLTGEFFGLTVTEWFGNASSMVLDNVIARSDQGGGMAGLMELSVDATSGNELVIGVFYPTNPTSPGAGWQTNGTLLPYGGIIYNIESTAGTYTPNGTQDPDEGGLYGMLCASFRGQGSSAPTPEPPYWVQIPEPTLSDGLTNVRNYCTSNGILISLNMGQQRSAKEWLQELCDLSATQVVWNGQSLDFVTLSEVAEAGNGAVYTPPTAAGPLITINDKWYVVDGAEAPVQVVQQDMQSVYNQVDIMYSDKHGNDTGWVGTASGSYNQTNVTICDQQHAFTYGTMIGSPIGYDDYIVDAGTAVKAGWPVMKRQRFMDPYHLKCKLPVNMSLLDPMDLITLQEPYLFGGQPYVAGGTGSIDVRIVSMTEDKDMVWDIECERFLFGCHAPQAPSITYASPPSPPSAVTPGGFVNTPYFFEPTASLSSGVNNEIWIAVSGSDPNYGGCQVWNSTDGGSSYQQVGNISGSATMGVLTSDYPLNGNPDNTDTLQVDLTESNGTLQSWTTDQQNLLVPIALIDGGGPVSTGGFTTTVPYEIVSYGTVTMTGASLYNLTPPILRGQQGTPVADHPLGNVFVDLSSTLEGVFKGTLPSSAVNGSTTKWKFPTYNTYGSGLQDLSDCVEYDFTVTGLANPNNSGSSAYTVAPSPCLYQGQTGGWAIATTGDPNSTTWTDPTKIYFPSVTANFSSGAVVYSANDSGVAAFTNPAGGQTVYVTIYDPTRLGGSQTINVDSNNTNATTPGYTYLGQLTSNAYNTSTGTGGGGTATGGSGSSAPGGPSSTTTVTSLTRTNVAFIATAGGSPPVGIDPGDTATGFFNIAKSYALFTVTASYPCRVVLYGNSAAQTDDAGRAYNVEPTVDGVLVDVTLDTDSSLTKIFTPPVLGMNSDTNLSATVYWSVTNNYTSTEAITVTLKVLPFEI